MGGSVEEHLFHKVGPYQLKNVNWDEPNHCRIVAASLVQAVYTLENDRNHNREGVNALAPHWWLFFDFEMIALLPESSSGSIIAAIFRYKGDSTEHSAPRYVISFRGTIPTFTKDLKVNWSLVKQELKKTRRFKETVLFVEKHILNTENIWLTGHSMGASMALQLGKKWVIDDGVFIRTYLFNPPFISASFSGWIKDEDLRNMVHAFNSSIKVAWAGLNWITNPRKSLFKKFAGWKPMLYVHASDPVCTEYINYFQKRDKLKKIDWCRWMEMTATRHSKATLFQNSWNNITNKEDDEEDETMVEALHLIPSATLVENKTRTIAGRGFFKPKCYMAHKLNNWWRADIELVTIDYEYED